MTTQKPKTPFYLIDTAHPFYRPLAVRLIIVALALFWTIIELYSRDMFFLVISAAILAYTTWVLLLTYHPPEPVPVRLPDPVEDEPDDDDSDETTKTGTPPSST